MRRNAGYGLKFLGYILGFKIDANITHKLYK